MENLYNRELHQAIHRIIDIIMEYATQDKDAECDINQRYLQDLRWNGVIERDYHFQESIFHSRRNRGIVITIDTTNTPEDVIFGVPYELITPWGIWRPMKTGVIWGAQYPAWEKIFPELRERLQLEPAFIRKPTSNIHIPDHRCYAVRNVEGYKISEDLDLGFCRDDEKKEIAEIWNQLQKEKRGV